MARQLTQAALQRLNELIADGVSFKDAMAQVAAWEDARAVEKVPPAPPQRPTTTVAEATSGIDSILENLREVGVVPDEPGNGCSPDEIAALEGADAIDDELEQMKKALGKGSAGKED